MADGEAILMAVRQEGLLSLTFGLAMLVAAIAIGLVLRNTINLDPAIPLSMEFGIIGFVILAGLTVDELFKRLRSRRTS